MIGRVEWLAAWLVDTVDDCLGIHLDLTPAARHMPPAAFLIFHAKFMRKHKAWQNF